jgi:4-oxalocrotonate tautomerase
MALVQVTLAKGRTRDQLHALSGALTDEVEELLGSRRESIRVILTECEPERWFAAGETLAERRAR